MAVGTLQQLTVKGVRRELQETIDAYPQDWREHVTLVDSNTEVEPFAWAGAIPQPRIMLDGRLVRDIRTFTYNITNNEYELTVLFPRKWFEDDQTGAIRIRISELATSWMNYKPYLFAQMLINGGSNNAYDGNTFFDDTRTEGDSGTIDNDLTSAAAADSAVPTATEFLTQLSIIKAAMRRFNDDSGQPANVSAMTRMGIVAPGEMEKEIMTALSSTLISNTDNVWGRNIAKPYFSDFLPYSGSTTICYVHAMGSAMKGIIYQQRTPMELVLFDGAEWMDANDGLLITLRERFVFAYGQFRRMARQTFTT